MRRAAWFVPLALLAIGVPGAHAVETVKATQAVASFSFLPADYAQDAGYFKAEGLDVQQIATRGGGPDMSALISGDVNFNFGAGSTRSMRFCPAGGWSTCSTWSGEARSASC
jgi:ABC-type nitrate/sulfonate/bicarbonate transport system substrate-binding protein